MQNDSDLRSVAEADARNLDKAALAVLDEAAREQHPEAFAVLEKFVSDEDTDPFVRAALVSLLRAFPGKETEQLLLSIVADDEPLVVRAKAFAALMQVGSVAALDPLERLASSGPEDTRGIAGFTHTIIAHRLGQRAPLLRLPDRDEMLQLKERAAGFQSRPLAPMLLRTIVADLERDRFKVSSYSTVGVEVRCGRSPWALILAEHAAAGGLSDAVRNPSILGVLARRSEEHRRWSVSRIILTGPVSDNEFYAGIFRRDGRLDLFGVGNSAERTIELAAAKRPGAVAVSARCYWYGNAPVIAGITGLDRMPSLVPVSVKVAAETSGAT
jgi:hypothetical protein